MHKFFSWLKKNWLLLLSLLLLLINFLGLFFFLGQELFWQRMQYFHRFNHIKLTLEYPIFQIWPSSLPHYELIISEKNQQELRAMIGNRPFYYVPATFIANNKEYKVKIRYHGDGGPHWTWPKKSWKVRFSNKLFDGTKKISLILPIERHYIMEHFSNYRAGKLGLFVPESKFASLSINGEFQGLYMQIEDFSPEFLAKQHKADDADLFEGDANVSKNKGGGNLFGRLVSWEKEIQFSRSEIDDYAPIQKLLEILFQYPLDEFPTALTDLIDMEQFTTWQAHAMLARSFSQNNEHNLYWYFNRDKGKIEFIPWDVRIFTWHRKIPLKHYPDENSLSRAVLSYLPFLIQRNQVLWEYVKDEQNLKDDLDFLKKTWQQSRRDFYLGKDRIRPMADPKLVVSYSIGDDLIADDVIEAYKKAVEFIFHSINSEIQTKNVKTKIQIPCPANIIDKSQTDKKILTKLIIKPEEAAISPTLLKNISFTVKQKPDYVPPNNPPRFYLFFDQNNNKLLEENGDFLLSEITYDSREQQFTFNEFNDILMRNFPYVVSSPETKQLLLYSSPYVPKDGRAYNFFIITDSYEIRISDVILDLENSTTHEKSDQLSL